MLLFRNEVAGHQQLYPIIDRAVKSTDNGSLRLRFTDLPFVEIKDVRADDYIGIYVIVFGGFFCYGTQSQRSLRCSRWSLTSPSSSLLLPLDRTCPSSDSLLSISHLVGKTDDGFWSRAASHRQGEGNWKLKPVKEALDGWQHGIAIGFKSLATHYRGRVVAGLET